MIAGLFGANAPVMALPDETWRIVATRLAVHGLERLPVVADSQSRKLVGIVSRSDLVKPSLANMKDLTLRECVILFPMIALTILFGVYPKPVLDMSAASVQQLVNNYNTAVTAVKAAALLP